MGRETEADDEAAMQLQSELRSLVSSTFNARSKRPILKRLNADSSWLLSLTYPDGFQPPPGRYRYNIIIDVWLQGSQTDVNYWFSTQWHAIKSSVETIEQLNRLLQEAERHALAECNPGKRQKTPSKAIPENFIDVVICSHEFTDHCHEATLREIDPRVPVFAPKKAAELIKSWEHFRTVKEVPVLGQESEWQAFSEAPLPTFVGFSRMETKAEVYSKLHTGLLIFTNLGSTAAVEAIIYTPHGIELSQLQALSDAQPAVKILALLHGLNHVTVAGSSINLGMHNARKILQHLKSHYWIATHDEIKIARGIISLFLRHNKYLVEEVPELQTKDQQLTPEAAFVALGNGECLVLEDRL